MHGWNVFWLTVCIRHEKCSIICMREVSQYAGHYHSGLVGICVSLGLDSFQLLLQLLNQGSLLCQVLLQLLLCWCIPLPCMLLGVCTRGPQGLPGCSARAAGSSPVVGFLHRPMLWRFGARGNSSMVLTAVRLHGHVLQVFSTK